MSVIAALRESFGSTSPNAFPTIFWYCPALPNMAPPNVGDCTLVTAIFVIRALAGTPQSRIPSNKTRNLPKVLGKRECETAGHNSSVIILKFLQPVFEVSDRLMARSAAR
jgi:hypothetical protein